MASASPSTVSSAFSSIVSPGGIACTLVEHDAPMVVLDFGFKNGASGDPMGKPGVARLVSGLLDEGADSYDSSSFQEAMADKAIDLHFSASMDSFHGTLKTLSAHRDGAFDLLRLALNAPRFDAEPLERVRAQMTASLLHEAKDPDRLSAKAFYETVFAGHPYGRPTSGSVESIATIERDDLVDFQKRALSRADLCVTAVGAIDAETLGKAVDHIFGGLPSESTVTKIGKTIPSHMGDVSAIDLDVSQTTLLLGTPGFGRHDPDYVAGLVVNHVLGGGSFTSRLWNEVRETRGLAYGVWSSLSSMRHSALFMVGTATKNERTREALDVIRAEMTKMGESGPLQSELEQAKKFLIGSYALRFDTSTKIATQITHTLLDGLDVGYISERNSLIAALTLEDVARAARRLLAGASFVVAVGRPVGLSG